MRECLEVGAVLSSGELKYAHCSSSNNRHLLCLSWETLGGTEDASSVNPVK